MTSFLLLHRRSLRLATATSLAATVLAGGAAMTALPAAADQTITKQYVIANDASGTVNPLAVLSLAPGHPTGCAAEQSPGISGACFDIQPGSLDIAVVDVAGGAVNASIGYKDTSKGTTGTIVKTDYFCGSAKGLTVPDGASLGFVNVFDGAAPTGKIPCGGPKPAFEGTITLSGPGAGVPTLAAPAHQPSSSAALGRTERARVLTPSALSSERFARSFRVL